MKNAQKQNASAKQSAKKQNTKNGKSEAEKQAAREARTQARIERICALAQKAGAWREAKGLTNKAGAHEKDVTLAAAAAIYTHTDTDGRAATLIREAVRKVATNDLKAVLNAVPSHILANAVTYTGAVCASTIARAMSHEIAKNPKTALAVAQAAQEATRKAARKARKAAKKAEKAAQGKAGAK